MSKNVDFLVENILKDISKPKKKLNENLLDFPKKMLCPDIWSIDKKLKPAIKNEILRRFDRWHQKMAPEMKITNKYILGSITTYQYNDNSDVDVNFIVSWAKPKIDKIWKTLPNGTEIAGHPLNFYLTANEKDMDMSKFAYDMENDTWVKEPKKEKGEIPVKYSLEIAKFFMDAVDLRVAELERDKMELEKLEKLLKNNDTEMDKDEIEDAIATKKDEVLADVDSVKLAHYMIKGFRKEGFDDDAEKWKFKFGISVNQDNDPNKSINNLIYKQLEQFGYFAKMEKIEKEND